MFKIGKIPRWLESFFSSLLPNFLWDHGSYFQSLVLALAFAWGRRNVTNLYRFIDAHKHRTRFNNFFHCVRANLSELLRLKAAELLQMAEFLGEKRVYLIIDDTRKGKRGKYMEAVGFIYDDLLDKVIQGHLYVVSLLRVRPVLIPFGVKLYVKKELCPQLGLEFQKMTEIAASFIQSFQPPQGLEVIVLFDSFYLCPVVLRAVREKGFHFISTLKDNRKLFIGASKSDVATYKKKAFKKGKKKRLYLGQKVQFAYKDMGWRQIRRLGRARIVLSRKNSQRKILAIVTDHPTLSAENIIRAYANRPQVEQFFKDAKQLLGLGQYQNRSYKAAVTHLHLVLFAYALLTHLRLYKARGAKGKRKRREVAGMSVFEAQIQLRHLVWEEIVKYLEQIREPKRVFKELRRLIVAA